MSYTYRQHPCSGVPCRPRTSFVEVFARYGSFRLNDAAGWVCASRRSRRWDERDVGLAGTTVWRVDSGGGSESKPNNFSQWFAKSTCTAFFSPPHTHTPYTPPRIVDARIPIPLPFSRTPPIPLSRTRFADRLLLSAAVAMFRTFFLFYFARKYTRVSVCVRVRVCVHVTA